MHAVSVEIEVVAYTLMSLRGLLHCVVVGFNFAVLPKHLLQYWSKLYAVIKLMDLLHLLNGG